MTRRLVIAFLAAALAVPLVVLGAGATPAEAADGLTYRSTTTYTLDAQAGVVHVLAEIALTNTIPDKREGNIINRRYFTGFSLPVPVGITNAVATTADGRALTVEPRLIDGNSRFYLFDISLGRNLFYDQTANIRVAYDITGVPPRSENQSRVNSAYASFTAFGAGDDGEVTVRIVVPPGFEVETFGSDAVITEEFGNTVYTATDIPNPEEFEIFVSARNDAGLVENTVTTPSGDTFLLRTWPGDTEWLEFVTTQVEGGVPALSDAIGQPWPIDETLEVRQAYTPYLYGYAGWFSAAGNEIEIGEDLDAEVMLHELSHAWFNDNWFIDRWLSEGFAQAYSNVVVEQSGGSPERSSEPASNDVGKVRLNSWGEPDFTDGAGEVERYGYNASYWLVQQLLDEIGDDAMREVLAGVADRTISYRGEGPAEDLGMATDWRVFLDLAENVGGSKTVLALLEQYVVTGLQEDQLAARADAREAYAQLVDRSEEWGAPYIVRRRMAAWAFPAAHDLIDDATGVLDLRDELDLTSAELGVGYPSTFEGLYESTKKDFAEVTDEIQQQIDTADAVLTAVTTEAADDGIFDTVGLIGTDLQAMLDEAKAALERGDHELARAKAQEVSDTVERAPDLGKTRSLWVGGGALLFLLVLALAIVLLRRRRRRRRATEAVGSGDLRSLELDEDALARAGDGSVDDLLLVPQLDDGEAAGTAGIVEREAELGDIGDPVFQLHEDVGTMVDAKAVASAEVLVDPHPHQVKAIGAEPTMRDPAPTSPSPVTLSTVQAPIAKQVPHVWQRPTGDAVDPWAWLRDRGDPDTVAYLTAENEYSTAWFERHRALSEDIFAEIKSRVQETDLSAPVRKDDWWYVTRTEEGASYPIHCRGREAATAHEQVILDENAEADGHEFFAVNVFDVSPQHTVLAWSSDTDGSEQYTMRFRDLDSGVDRDEQLEGTTWGGTAWSADGTTLFYVTADEQMRPYRVWRHLLGTMQTDDVLVLEELDERFYVYVDLSRSGEWVVIDVGSKLSSEVHLIPSADPTAAAVVVRPRADDLEYGLEHWGDRWVVLTNLDATDFRVMTAPLDQPADWTELVPHVAGRRITSVEAFAGHLVLHEWADAQPRIRVLFRDGTERIVHGPDAPHDLELESNPEWTIGTVRYVVQSLTQPVTVYEEDVRTGEQRVLKRTPVPGVDLSAYDSRREWATAPDGMQVPVDIVYRAGSSPDGTAPLVVYGYGSYEASVPPWFSAARLSLLDRGVVWALVHPRGGGELGREWYLKGKLEHKRNTFIDTNACVEHLVAKGWGDPTKVAIRGGSAGGLLVGACITMRPSLYRAAVAEVPFVDVVTTMADPTLPLTITEWEEWGDPREQPMAEYMLGYSPYDHTTATDYPAIYITAGLNDPRVSYHEPAKWIAKLRATRTNDATLLLRCEMGAGHAGPSGRYESWRDEARVLTFLLTELA